MMVVAGNFFLKKYISNCVILRAYDAHTREKKFFLLRVYNVTKLFISLSYEQ